MSKATAVKERYVSALKEFREYTEVIPPGLKLAILHYEGDWPGDEEECDLLFADDGCILVRARGNHVQITDDTAAEYLANDNYPSSAMVLLGPGEFLRRLEARRAERNRPRLGVSEHVRRMVKS